MPVAGVALTEGGLDRSAELDQPTAEVEPFAVVLVGEPREGDELISKQRTALHDRSPFLRVYGLILYVRQKRGKLEEEAG